jgi:hypothetical protein
MATLRHLRRRLFVGRRRWRFNLRTRLERCRLDASRRRDGIEQGRLDLGELGSVSDGRAAARTGSGPHAYAHDHDADDHDHVDDAHTPTVSVVFVESVCVLLG